MTELTFLRARNEKRMAKEYRVGEAGSLIISNYQQAYLFGWQTHTVKNIRHLKKILAGLLCYPETCIIRGAPKEGLDKFVARSKENFPEPEEGRDWVMLDIDGVEPPEGMAPWSREAVEYVTTLLPAEFQGVSYVAVLSNSAGIRTPEGALLKSGVRVHLFYLLDRPIPGGMLSAWLELRCYDSGFYEVGLNKGNIPMVMPGIDMAPIRSCVQIHYTAEPIIGEGVVCEVKPGERVWLVEKGADVASLPELSPQLLQDAKERREEIRTQWALENGFRLEQRRVRTSGSTYTSERLVPQNSSDVRLGRELIEVELRAEGNVLGLKLANEKTPNSWYVLKRSPWLARRMGDEMEIPLEEFCPAAVEKVRELGWIRGIEDGHSGSDGESEEAARELVLTRSEAPSGLLGAGEVEEHINWQFKLSQRYFMYAQDGLLGTFKTEEKETKFIPACSLFYVHAKAYLPNQMGLTYVIHLKDSSNVWKEVWLPAKDIFDGNSLLMTLADAGAYVEGKAKHLIASYIQTYPTENYWLMADRTGWSTSFDAFILPERAIVQPGQSHWQQTEIAPQAKQFIGGFRCMGTLQEWQEHVAFLCRGHSRLEMAIYLAFLPPLLGILGMSNFGVHFYGETSRGKTTATRVAGSVWGNPDEIVHHWRATDNGLEGLAYCHNDALLIMDEINQADPSTLGASVYMLSNGEGKARAGRTGDSRPIKTWKLAFLSTGEIASADYLRGDGRRVMGGQTVRLMDLPIEAGRGMGVVERLDHFSEPGALVRELNRATSQYYGSAVVAFLEGLLQMEDLGNLQARYEGFRRHFLARLSAAPRGAQLERIVGQFTQIAFAGELAIGFGVLPWEPGLPTATMLRLVGEYEQLRGGSEGSDILETIFRMRREISIHRYRNFLLLSSPGNYGTYLPAPAIFWGYAVLEDGSDDCIAAFKIPVRIFREVFCQGVDHRQVKNAMEQRGWLERDTHQYGRARERCYSIPYSFVASEDLAEVLERSDADTAIGAVGSTGGPVGDSRDDD